MAWRDMAYEGIAWQTARVPAVRIVSSVPAVPMTEPIAREERLRMRQSGRKTKMERSTIMKLLLASSAGPPTSFPMEAKLSPTMIE